MPHQFTPPLPRFIWILIAFYSVASLTHFLHNAEYIAYYPNMPDWITRERVYLAWLGVASIGAVGIALAHLGWRTAAAIFIAAYGALGLDGLGHYALALCTQHTLAANLTIWFEVLAGSTLMLASGFLAARHVSIKLRSSSAA